MHLVTSHAFSNGYSINQGLGVTQGRYTCDPSCIGANAPMAIICDLIVVSGICCCSIDTIVADTSFWNCIMIS